MKKHICIQGNVVLLLLGLFGNIPLVSAALPPPCTGGFTPAFSAKTILQADWNETAVRKVMHAFAYGGFATDQQVQAWASMSPECAIQEILTFQNTNDLISPAGTNVPTIILKHILKLLKVMQLSKLYRISGLLQTL